jgi:hypothetical protein
MKDRSFGRHKSPQRRLITSSGRCELVASYDDGVGRLAGAEARWREIGESYVEQWTVVG